MLQYTAFEWGVRHYWIDRLLLDFSQLQLNQQDN